MKDFFRKIFRFIFNAIKYVLIIAVICTLYNSFLSKPVGKLLEPVFSKFVKEEPLYKNGLTRKQFIKKRNASKKAYSSMAKSMASEIGFNDETVSKSGDESRKSRKTAPSNALTDDTDKEKVPNNHCEEVTITPKVTDDLYILITRDDSEEKMQFYYDTAAVDMNHDIYRVYRTDEFLGELHFDLSDMLSENEMTFDNLLIYDMYESGNKFDYKRVKFNSEGNSITIRGKDVRDNAHTFVFMNDKSLSHYDENGNIIANPAETGDFLIYHFMISSLFFGRPSVYVVSSGDETYDQMLIEYAAAMADRYIADSDIFSPFNLVRKWEKPLTYRFNKVEADDVEIITEQEMKVKRKMLEIFRAVYENPCGIYFPYSPHYSAWGLSETENLYNPDDFKYSSGKKEAKTLKAKTDELIAKKKSVMAEYGYINKPDDFSDIVAENRHLNFTSDDMFCFSNFGSYISEGGNCAGISQYTSVLYNSGTFPASGSRTLRVSENHNGDDISWDLSDESNATLLDRTIQDYKDSKFRSRIESGDTSEAENQFVNMIGAMWDESNSAAFYELPVCDPNQGETPNFDRLPEIESILEDGRILQLCVGYKNKGEAYVGHAVNIVGYKKVDESTRLFYIYDSNTPEMLETATLTIMENEDGSKYYNFVYDSSYSVYLNTSSASLDYYFLEIYDENYNWYV